MEHLDTMTTQVPEGVSDPTVAALRALTAHPSDPATVATVESGTS
jgi:hypothetical protein